MNPNPSSAGDALARWLLRAAARLWLRSHARTANPWSSNNPFLDEAQAAYVAEASR